MLTISFRYKIFRYFVGSNSKVVYEYSCVKLALNLFEYDDQSFSKIYCLNNSLDLNCILVYSLEIPILVVYV